MSVSSINFSPGSTHDQEDTMNETETYEETLYDYETVSVAMLGWLTKIVMANEPALRLLLSVVAGYPFAILYRQFVFPLRSAILHHLYFIICGMFILLFNYGRDAGHTLFAIAVSCFLFRTLRGTGLVAVTLVFHMSYLLIGYLLTGTDTYDITWTMPHCILVLRLIGLSFDISDGQRPVTELSAENKKSCLATIPGVVETFAYSLFPASILVGPQFSYRRYNDFITGQWKDRVGCLDAGFNRASYGITYLLLNQIGSILIPDEYLRSADFDGHCMCTKWIIIAIWGKITLYKYIACWLFSEGAATCFGLTYVGQKSDDASVEDWSGLRNIRLSTFENASRFQHYIDAFNVNTNQWTAEYVYKRLKFLGNRNLSQAAALCFLAVWHGFHSGYYMSFGFEYVVMSFERSIQPVILRSDWVMSNVGQPVPSLCVWIALKFYTLVGIGWALVPFVFLSADKWWPIYQSLGYYGFWFFGPWPLYKLILEKILAPTRDP